MSFEIKHRITGAILVADEGPSVKDALVEAVKKGVDLSGADLRGADLNVADLSGADLSGVDLRGAYLRGADLRGANLNVANLSGVDLRGADLRGAYLRGADLSGADLRGANLNWSSSDLVAELLVREAKGDVEKRKIAGLVLVSRDWCWEEFLKIDDPLKEWALASLRKHVVAGDNAPKALVSGPEGGAS